MDDQVQNRFEAIPSFLGAPVGDLEDLSSGQVALAGYFCDNLNRPASGQRYLARQLRYASRPEDMTVGDMTVSDKTLNAIDLGDVNVFPLEPDKHFAAVVSQCKAVLGTGARMILVGGDPSGAEALLTAARHVTGGDVQEVSATEGFDSSDTSPVVLAVDLQQLAGNWLSHPCRLSGLTPAQMIAQIEAVSGNVIAAAIFGLAPALDCRGNTETRAALAILRALSTRLGNGAH